MGPKGAFSDFENRRTSDLDFRPVEAEVGPNTLVIFNPNRTKTSFSRFFHSQSPW
jgi:hypothetical protein